MQPLVTGKHRSTLHNLNDQHAGFSLLELLVVLVIIGIITSVALLALGNFGKTQQIQSAAEEFTNLIPLVEEQAILNSTIYGLQINAQGYGFYQIISQNKKDRWIALTNDPLLHFRTWPVGTKIQLVVSNQNTLPIPGPNIIINSSGDITPFVLKLGEDKPQCLIQVFENGQVAQTNL